MQTRARSVAVAAPAAPAAPAKRARVCVDDDAHIVAALRRPEHGGFGDDARLAFSEYTRFIALHRGDARAEDALSPGPRIDAVWHCHLLFTRHYAAFCRRHAGRIVHHDAARALDADAGATAAAARAARYAETLRRYKARYDALPPARMWPSRGPGSPPLGEGTPGFPPAPYVGAIKFLFYRAFNGKTHTLVDLHTRDPVEKLLALIAAKEEMQPDDIRIIYGGRQLEHGHTLGDFRLANEATVHVVARLRGC